MRGDRDAEFADYVDGRMTSFRRVAYLLCHDWHQADDLVQTSLVKLYTAWPRLREVGNADAYLRRIILRSFLDERRRLWRREVPTEALPEPAGHAPTNGVDDRMVLTQALRQLPPRQRAVVVLRCWEDLSVAETAGVLGCSEGAVKTHLSRGLAALRTVLVPTGPTLEGPRG
jgi:RNA polymerase sigma-70 factor (sigma-E family)